MLGRTTHAGAVILSGVAAVLCICAPPCRTRGHAVEESLWRCEVSAGAVPGRADSSGQRKGSLL